MSKAKVCALRAVRFEFAYDLAQGIALADTDRPAHDGKARAVEHVTDSAAHDCAHGGVDGRNVR